MDALPWFGLGFVVGIACTVIVVAKPARVTVPGRVRYARYLNEMRVLRRMFPACECWTSIDAEDFETMRAHLARQYGVSEDVLSTATTR